ncbi:minor tail protein [Arthrobacter phage AbbyDaisy]|nr:minor tail protein [Arthrobacter phage AbbyDaisy]
MALTSVFYDGYVTESDRAANRAGSPSYGVYGLTDFKVTAHPSIPFAVLVKAGRAFGHGVTDTAAVDQVVNCESLTGTNTLRWDLIVVRRNWQPALGGPSTLEVIQVGTNPVVPDAPMRKVGPGVEDDQPIALVQWNGGASAPFQIVDLRTWPGDGGGYVAVVDLVRTFLDDVGTRLHINGADWVCRPGDNDTKEWARLDLQASTKYGLVQPTGYDISGNVYVEQMSGRRRITVDVNVTRTGAAGTIPSNDWASFGAVLPTVARGDADPKYVPVSVVGGSVSTATNNLHATVFLNPSNGVMQIRGLSAFTWQKGALFSLNATYFIP